MSLKVNANLKQTFIFAQSIGFGVLGASGLGYAYVNENRYNVIQQRNTELTSRIDSLTETVEQQASKYQAKRLIPKYLNYLRFN